MENNNNSTNNPKDINLKNNNQIINYISKYQTAFIAGGVILFILILVALWIFLIQYKYI